MCLSSKEAAEREVAVSEARARGSSDEVICQVCPSALYNKVPRIEKVSVCSPQAAAVICLLVASCGFIVFCSFLSSKAVCAGREAVNSTLTHSHFSRMYVWYYVAKLRDRKRSIGERAQSGCVLADSFCNR